MALSKMSTAIVTIIGEVMDAYLIEAKQQCVATPAAWITDFERDLQRVILRHSKRLRATQNPKVSGSKRSGTGTKTRHQAPPSSRKEASQQDRADGQN